MNAFHPRHHSHARAYILFAGLSVVYILLSLFSPSSTASRLYYHISLTQQILLQLTILAPMITIWFIGLWGAFSVRTYAQLIKPSPEYKGLLLISTGLLWLVAYLVVISLLGSALPYLAQSSWLPVIIMLRHHVPVLCTLIGFAIICWGSLRLRTNTPVKVWTTSSWILVILLSLLAATFAWQFLTTTTKPDPGGLPSYTLPNQTLVFTLVLPYCWAWFLGLFGALNIAKYAKRVKGTLYRQALHHLALGIAVAVIMVIAIQFITFSNRFLSHLTLGWLLLVIYTLIAICAIGFWLIRSGAHKLTRIEVVQ